MREERELGRRLALQIGRPALLLDQQAADDFMMPGYRHRAFLHLSMMSGT